MHESDRARARARARARGTRGASRSSLRAYPRHVRARPSARDVRQLKLLPCDEHVEARRAFECGASRRVEIPAPILARTLAIAFCYVQRDRCARPLQLLDDAQVGLAERAVQKRTAPACELDGHSVHVESFVVESHSLPPTVHFEHDHEHEHEHGDTERYPSHTTSRE